MAHIIEGEYSGKDLRVGIVVSRFNEFVTKSMLEGALNELRRAGVSDADIHVVWVPGAYEIPFASQSLLESNKFDALVAIGCVIRGETSHYQHLAQAVCDGVQKVALERKIPIGFGVITVESMAQAIERAGGKHGNKGRDAAKSALEMVHIVRKFQTGGEKEITFKKLIEQEFKK
ncbi:MAG: 6,7-dimethyl-8-ribityllumazine synthase [Candidatus Omnitrophica bacterium]|nr:6,7-dimethyl-8-ribityllumazine synthase [Candidatus Omnitrophota bacterium]